MNIRRSIGRKPTTLIKVEVDPLPSLDRRSEFTAILETSTHEPLTHSIKAFVEDGVEKGALRAAEHLVERVYVGKKGDYLLRHVGRLARGEHIISFTKEGRET